MELKVGDQAPHFQTEAVGGAYGTGQTVKLADFSGSPLVLYFYPKDDTPGCTKQACDLRDAWGEIRSRAQLFGVSVDSTDSHRAFIDKYGLPFPLLSDPEHKLAEAYGAHGIRCSDPAKLDSAIMEMIETQGPVIFDCLVDQKENCFPMIPSGKAHNEMLLGDVAGDIQKAIDERGKVLV